MDEGSASVAQVSDFFYYLFETRKLQAVTIQSYRTVLASYIPDSVAPIKDSPEISKLLQSFFRDRPRSARSVAPWDLRIVLDSLTQAPFEPLETVDIKFLTMKTVFLISLASGRRCSDLRAMSFSRLKWRRSDGAAILNLLLDYLPKNLRSTDDPSTMAPIVIPSLAEYAGPDLPEEILNCPVRALKIYLNRTKDLRGHKQLLFVATVNLEREISVSTISGWISSCISLSYKEYRNRNPTSTMALGKHRAHDVRGLAASWAVRGQASWDQIRSACFWKTQTTFTSFYLKDLWVDSNDQFSLPPFVAAQTVLTNPGHPSSADKRKHCKKRKH